MNKETQTPVTVSEKRLPDLNGVPDGRTVFTFDGAVRLDVEVGQDSALRRRTANAPFEGRVSWGSRSGLTLDESEEFARALLDAVKRARADVAKRNGVLKESTVQSAQDFWVDWVSHRGSKDAGGCQTHAVPIVGPANAVCGVATGGDGAVMTVEQAGGVGCQRCSSILKKRGVLFGAAT